MSSYDSLRSPLCARNRETDRELRLVSVAVCLDGNKPGEYTARAIEALEPNVIWERHFLELRRPRTPASIIRGQHKPPAISMISCSPRL
jgi:hypothetical protein